MPVSDQSNISQIMSEVSWLRPRRILDLGVGFGKYGVLLRELLDIEPGRLHYSDWQITINGVEGCVKYAGPPHAVYNQILYEDIAQHVDDYRGYDLVLLIDVLEHFEKCPGCDILTSLLTHNKVVLVSTPNGHHPQGAVHHNEFEVHRSVWTAEEFTLLGGRPLINNTLTLSYVFGGRKG